MSAAFDARLGPHAEAPGKPHLHKPMDPRFALGILAVLAFGLFYMAYSIRSDIQVAGGGPTTILPFILLGLALLIALGFEFVNGFHDTANAVATVIYTHALPAQIAVVWSGCRNLLGVLASTGAVAFGVVSLLPVELILQVGSAAGGDLCPAFSGLLPTCLWGPTALHLAFCPGRKMLLQSVTGAAPLGPTRAKCIWKKRACSFCETH